MTLRIGICDDTINDIKILQKHIETYKIAYDIDLETESFSSGTKLLQSHKSNPYHIILLDIEMPAPSGMDIARCLRNQGSDDTFIVFITSYPQYMKDSFEVQPFQFLTKPIDFPMIEKLISDIVQRYQHSHTTKIIIDVDGEEHFIHINDILYMQAVKTKRPILNYVFSDAALIAQGTIKEWEETLSNYGFISPCRGYLVNIRHIHSFNQTRLLLTNGSEIPISRRRTKLVKQAYANRIIHVMN